MVSKKRLSIIYPHNQRLMSGKAHDIVIIRTCYALAQAGHEVKIITGKPSRPDTFFSYYGLKPIPGLQIVQVPMLRGRPFSWHGVFNFFCLLKIMELKKSGMADIVYLREIKLARFLLKFRQILKLPFVIEVHDLKIAKFYESCPERDKAEEYVFQRVNGIITLLHVFGDILKETYDIEGIPIEKVPLAAERMPFAYKNMGKETIIGYIGQLYPLQGVDMLIAAMEYLPDSRLSIIGGGEKDLPRLMNLAQTLHVDARIDFHGFIAPSLVGEKAREADVLVICAADTGKRRYAAHTKLYEYMAMGKPIVAVDLPSVREDAEDGRNVLFAKPGDPQDLAEKIRYVLHNHAAADSLARGAYASAEAFTWDKRAARLSSFFREILMNSQGGARERKQK